MSSPTIWEVRINITNCYQLNKSNNRGQLRYWRSHSWKINMRWYKRVKYWTWQKILTLWLSIFAYDQSVMLCPKSLFSSCTLFYDPGLRMTLEAHLFGLTPVNIAGIVINDPSSSLFCISLGTNALEKGLDPYFLLLPRIGK